MSYTRQHARSSAALLLAMALTACGGGGGGGASGTSGAVGSSPAPAAPAPSPAPSPSPAASEASPAVPPPPAGSTPASAPGSGVVCTPEDLTQPRSGAFALINLTRLALGLPQLTRLPALDGTAQAHARYVIVNNEAGVTESPDRPCFTGTDLEQRLTAAGVASTESPGLRQRTEIVLAYRVAAGAEPESWAYANDMLSNLYGRIVLLDARMQQVGLGYSAEADGQRRALVLDTTVSAGAALPNPNVFAVWPRDGATGLPTRMHPSDVKPLAAGLVEGYPVTLHAGAVVQVTRFAMFTASSGAPVEATAVTGANDRNGLLTASEAALVPHAPLAAGTTYRVEFDGIVGVTPLHLVWSFTTTP